MTELLTATQMRAIEQAAIESGVVTGLELMERAGRGVVAAIFEEWSEFAPAVSAGRGPAPEPPGYFNPKEGGTRFRAVVLCGPGNNGGDGFVVARLLAEAGWEVEVFLYGDAERLPQDARVNYERWAAIGAVQTLTDDGVDGYAEDNPGTLIAIDALFGTGLSRPFIELGRVQDELNYWQASSQTSDTPFVVSIDIPSGVCADSGRYLGMDGENPYDLCIMANLTVTFHAQKLGHVLGDGSGASSKLVIVNIGIDSAIEAPEPVVTCAAVPAKVLGKSWAGHKFAHGHALILSGGVGRGGAARLAARGALRIGAGVVTVGCPPSALMENAIALDAVMVRKLADGRALTAALEDKRITALCLGPGLGTTAREVDMVGAVLSDKMRATCLDADALTVLAAEPDLFAMLHERCVLTPHAGEFARLFPELAARLAEPATKGPAYSKVDATRDAAQRAGCVVLFKGADTVIADPSGQCRVNAAVYDRAAPWLATAGSGDVLAGFITGLMARGFAPMQAAEMGAWLHVECARRFGPGLIAEDLPEQLPGVFSDLGL